MRDTDCFAVASMIAIIHSSGGQVFQAAVLDETRFKFDAEPELIFGRFAPRSNILRNGLPGELADFIEAVDDKTARKIAAVNLRLWHGIAHACHLANLTGVPDLVQGTDLENLAREILEEIMGTVKRRFRMSDSLAEAFARKITMQAEYIIGENWEFLDFAYQCLLDGETFDGQLVGTSVPPIELAMPITDNLMEMLFTPPTEEVVV